MDLTSYFVERKDSLEKNIRRIERKLTAMPEGTIVHLKQMKNGKPYNVYYKQLVIDGHKVRSVISKRKNIKEARLLAQKSYLSRALRDMRNELKCVDFYLNHRKPEDYSALIGTDSPYRELLISQHSIVDEWEHEPYIKSKDHPEHLLIPAPKGELVRSKAEAMIAQSLFNHHIPYRYEEIHDIYGAHIATDFTIMHPKTHQIFLWEHFGRCDEPDYQKTIDFKMYHYIRAGCLPGRTMIMTFEDSKHPLSFLEVEEIVQRFFM